MAKIARKTALPFGSAASAGQIGEFGSFAATGTGVTSTDPAVIQSLSQWLAGWYSAVVNGNSPPIQDMNGFCYVAMYMICYLMQEGVPEWDSGTTYYKGSIVTGVGTGALYTSLTDSNTNNALTDGTNWSVQGNGMTSVSANYTVLQTDDFIKADSASASFTVTLPAVASTPAGKKYIIKNVNLNVVTVAGNGAENIDSNNTLPLNTMDSVTVINNGTQWNII